MKSYDAAREHADLQSEIERLGAQRELSWPNELRALKAFGLRDGMTVADLGCLRHYSLSAMQIAARAADIRWRLEAVLKNNLVPANGEGDQPVERDHTSMRAA